MEASAANSPSVSASERYFNSLESAIEFISLLETAVHEAKTHIAGRDQIPLEYRDEDYLNACRLAQFKLNQLAETTSKCRRLLNDVGIIRGVLTAGRTSAPSP